MKENDKLNLLFQELNENPYRQLNFAFLLISVIPVLTIAYVFIDQFIGNKVLHNVIPVLAPVVLILILGYTFAYGVIRTIINKTLSYAAKAKRADELKSIFAMSLAHDLKSPLLTIKTNVANLERESFGKLTEEQKTPIRLCKDVAERMDSLIMKLLYTYIFEAHMADFKPSRFDLRDLIIEQKRELDAIALSKNITIDVELSQKPLMIEADREKMLRVINNLLNNSVKHTPNDGKVTVKVYFIHNFIRMEFLNTGLPIPEDKLDKIFDKFERFNPAVEGHGLGLGIAKDIVELHKGEIWATSGPGKPNCFTVLLVPAKE
ncbi:MAG: HAMP domain-containing sensor histidine kinase [Candidatus Omnitrophica bacterium]|nr:HAMP domain-containing sensor histidine kinase [Candidatus Omnitrophota bacterium]